MGCNPSKDGAVSEAGGGGGGGGVVKAGDKSSSSTTAKNDVAETFLIPLSDGKLVALQKLFIYTIYFNLRFSFTKMCHFVGDIV